MNIKVTSFNQNRKVGQIIEVASVANGGGIEAVGKILSIAYDLGIGRQILTVEVLAGFSIRKGA